MKKVIVLIVLVLLGVGAYFGYNMLYPKPVATNPAPVASSGEVTTYTIVQIAEHPDAKSCWMAIEGKVYDVTPFITGGFHPGGDAILQGCGKDATVMFNSRPTNGTSHSSRTRQMLVKYFIGNLAQ